jgi:uncharacterized protein YbbC (DUF1343 family)
MDKNQTQEVFTDKDILKFINKIYKTSNRYRLTVEEIKSLKQIYDRLEGNRNIQTK